MKESFLPAINLALLDVSPQRLTVHRPLLLIDSCPAVVCENYHSLAYSLRLDFFAYGTPLEKFSDGVLIELRYGQRVVLVRKVDWHTPVYHYGKLLLSPDAFRFLSCEEPTDKALLSLVDFFEIPD